MPKYYCDYCDAFLTHDSPSVRKTHNGGRKHKENVRSYYESWMAEQAQKLVDATARAFQQQRMMHATAALGVLQAVPPGGLIPPRGAMIPPPGMPMRPGMPMMPPYMPPGGIVPRTTA
ncbi:u1 zinc finger domain-containing protein [Ditylenchus destructor]|uniref:U1 small nuclear ribonucleoprotein C n=1 Tax=Ditylenchus destructor TaxID=166010 RepID=A0AAD4MKD5_9BILA|nr:u1 zinc finger domain-containing protein [Ditylenchus destructor]